MAKQKKETKKIILKSVLSNRGNTPHFWWCGSKTPSSPLSLADLPLIKASYDGAKQVTPLGEVLSLLGTAIIDGGLFALWKKRCNSRLDCGRKSQHYPKNQTPPQEDLAPLNLITNRMETFDTLIRKISAKAISL